MSTKTVAPSDAPEIAVEQATKELLEKLTIDATVTVEKVTDEATQTDHFQVTIETAESGLLIGHHGETLNSFQLMLGVLLFKKLGAWVHVIVDVGQYRKMRAESIHAMVDRIADEVAQSGQPVMLPPLTPLERRMVHVHIGNHPTVMSESEGVGRDRRVMIKPKATA